MYQIPAIAVEQHVIGMQVGLFALAQHVCHVPEVGRLGICLNRVHIVTHPLHGCIKRAAYVIAHFMMDEGARLFKEQAQRQYEDGGCQQHDGQAELARQSFVTSIHDCPPFLIPFSV